MMLIKLSLKNARKTFSDYAIYTLTVSMMISLNFMLNRLIFSPEIRELTSSSSGMQITFAFASFIMLIVLFSLIRYMTRFILNHRSKEFGLYQLMGIENKKIKKIYWIEQCYLGGVSILIGLAIGILVGEVLRSIVFNYIGCISYQFTIEGIFTTIWLTILEIVIIYMLIRMTGRKLFHARSILNWLQADRKNEKVRANGSSRYVLTVVWLLLGVIAILLLGRAMKSGESMEILGCVAMLLAATFGFSTCIIRIISEILLRNDNQFTSRVLYVRFVSKRIATRSKQIGILAMLFVGGMALLVSGMLFGNYIREYNKEYSGFDFYYTPDMQDGVTDEFIAGMEEVLNEYGHGIKDKYIISGYNTTDSELFRIYSDDKKRETIVSLSTYNHVREMLGKEDIFLEEDEFLIQTHCQLMDAPEIFNRPEYQILGKERHLQSININPMNTFCVANGDAYYLVVPDEAVAGLQPSYRAYAYNLESIDDNMLLYSKMLDYAQNKDVGNILIETDSINKLVKNGTCLSSNFCITNLYILESATSFASISIALLFMGIVFTLVLSTVLAVLLTSEIGENRQRFLTLHRLGASKEEQEGTLRKQIESVFALPVIIGLPLAATVCLVLANLLRSIMTVEYLIINIGITILIFMIMYSIYMIVTYQSLKKGVMCRTSQLT